MTEHSATTPTVADRSEVDSLRGWLVATTTFVVLTIVFAVVYGFSAFVAPLIDEFGSTNRETALLFAVLIAAFYFASLPVGWASDRWGPRPVLAFAAVMVAGGLWATAGIDRLWAGYVTYGLGVGIGASGCYVPMVAQVTAWFERRRAAAIGVAVSGIAVGTLIGPVLCSALIMEFGWRGTYRRFAVVILVVLVVAVVAVRRAPAVFVDDETRRDRGRLVASTTFRYLYGAGVLIRVVLFVPFVFLVPYGLAAGFSPRASAVLLSVVGVASLVGRLALGPFVARFGVLTLYRVCVGLLAASFVVWLTADDRYVQLLGFGLLLGLSYGAYIVLTPAAVTELFGLSGLGGVLGALYTSGGIGALIGSPLAGWLVDRTGGYNAAIAMSLLLGLAASALLHVALRSAGAVTASER